MRNSVLVGSFPSASAGAVCTCMRPGLVRNEPSVAFSIFSRCATSLGAVTSHFKQIRVNKKNGELGPNFVHKWGPEVRNEASRWISTRCWSNGKLPPHTQAPAFPSAGLFLVCALKILHPSAHFTQRSELYLKVYSL